MQKEEEARKSSAFVHDRVKRLRNLICVQCDRSCAPYIECLVSKPLVVLDKPDVVILFRARMQIPIYSSSGKLLIVSVALRTCDRTPSRVKREEHLRTHRCLPYFYCAQL
jgi:hypothetical protein